MKKVIASEKTTNTRVWGLFVLFVCLAVMFVQHIQAEVQNHIGTNQKTLVICIKYSDVPTTRLETASNWVELLNIC